MKTDPRMIDIVDDGRPDDRPVEIPVFSIETTKDNVNEQPNPKRKDSNTPLIFSGVLIFIALCAVIGWIFWEMGPRTEVESSVSDAENINLLKEPYAASAKGTVSTSDSILGVAFDMYSLSGLRGSLEKEMPDTADRSVVLFMRSADYQTDGTALGTIIVDGKRLPSKKRVNRQGYLALSKDGRPVLGISLSDKTADFAESSGGSLFRQFVLLGDGELPRTFALHGKVERSALGRMADGKLYYVVTRHKETMYDFADALREYGFLDAVYVTGGNNYTFHRDADLNSFVSYNTREKIAKYSDSIPPVPLLVFRNK